MFDHDMLARTLAAQHQVITRQQAISCGVPRSTVNLWCGSDGKWQKLLPGVYLTVTGKPTRVGGPLGSPVSSIKPHIA